MAAASNVVAIRPDIPIPAQREEDNRCIAHARVSRTYAERSYELAQTKPNSRAHRIAEHLAGEAASLPRNNLRLIVRPISPRREWFGEALDRYRVAKAAKELVESRWSLAYTLDMQDGGKRHDALEADRTRCQHDLEQAIEDALRTPTTRKFDARRKQEIVGKREWAAKYRPAWQAMIDEDLARYAPRPRRPAKASG